MRVVLFILILFLPSSLSGQNKIGLINEDSAMKFLFEYAIFEADFKLKSSQFDDSLEILEKNYEDIVLHSPHIRKDLLEDSLFMQLYLQEFTERLELAQNTIDYFTLNGVMKLESYREYHLGEIKNTLRLKMVEFCKLNQIQMLVDKNSLVYCESCKDYTGEFIEFLQNH